MNDDEMAKFLTGNSEPYAFVREKDVNYVPSSSSVKIANQSGVLDTFFY